MSNKNGMGPKEEGPRTGRGLGACENGSSRFSSLRNKVWAGRNRGKSQGLGLRRRASNN